MQTSLCTRKPASRGGVRTRPSASEARLWGRSRAQEYCCDGSCTIHEEMPVAPKPRHARAHMSASLAVEAPLLEPLRERYPLPRAEQQGAPGCEERRPPRRNAAAKDLAGGAAAHRQEVVEQRQGEDRREQRAHDHQQRATERALEPQGGLLPNADPPRLEATPPYRGVWAKMWGAKGGHGCGGIRNGGMGNTATMGHNQNGWAGWDGWDGMGGQMADAVGSHGAG